MADINQIITLGIGDPADIEHLTLVGLNSNPVIPPTGDSGLSGNSGMSGLTSGTDDWDVE